jgi:hypothetical protein
MKLPEHVDIIREKISKAFNNQFSRLGFGAAKLLDIDKIPVELHTKRNKIEQLVKNHEGETGTYIEAREKALEELTFTLFNRLAAIKVMEALQLFPPIVSKQAEHGGRSLGHKVWLEQNPAMRNEELEGLREYFKYEFNKLGDDIPLFHKNYPYAFIPFVIEFNEIIDAINNIELDAQLDDNIWQSDDILGWLYESYNNAKKQAHKDSGDKTEYNKVSLQSQVYTPRWVVEFLVHNSLGKMYLEMYPDSAIGKMYKIANAPTTRVRELKPLHMLRLIDPASGSGNFLLYAFAFFYALYLDQIENYDAEYEIDDIPKLIIENNLYGIDLDDRAAQLAQLGLWIKAKQKNRATKSLRFNVVSSDFYLPAFEEVLPIFQTGISNDNQRKIVSEIWSDLQQAYKFGSLVKIDEKLSVKLHGLVAQEGVSLFGKQELEEYKRFTEDFFKNLEIAVAQFAEKQGVSFLTDKTKDAITFLKLISQKYDVITANPPYTDAPDFGPDLKLFIEENYKTPFKFHTNLYSVFIKRSFELLNKGGFIGMLHPLTFMYIKTFEDVRKYIINNSKIEILVELGLGGVFLMSNVQVYAVMYILKYEINNDKSLFFDLKQYHNHTNKSDVFNVAISNYLSNGFDKHSYNIDQKKLKEIKSWPFVYWISESFRDKFSKNGLGDKNKALTGLMTGDNSKYLRFWWEVKNEDISIYYPNDKKKWVFYQKGGPFVKWYGNNWLVVNFENNGSNLATTDNKEFYFKEGISYSASGSKGASFRFIENKYSFDKGGPCIFSIEEKLSNYYLLGLLNSKLSSYIVNCLNPTVNTQVGDLRRIPIVYPENNIKNTVEELVRVNIEYKKLEDANFIYNPEFIESPLLHLEGSTLLKKLKLFNDIEIQFSTIVILNEAIINNYVFKIYALSDDDIEKVILEKGPIIGSLPVLKVAKEKFLEHAAKNIQSNELKDFIGNLSVESLDETKKEIINSDLTTLFDGNKNLEEFCILHEINPINVWYLYFNSNILPKQRMNLMALEFLASLVREVLLEDSDGIIPLVPNAGEKILIHRIEEKFESKGLSRSMFSSFDSILDDNINNYLNSHFFKDFSFHMKLFKKISATPFIWHLTSGPEQGFDCYLIIYKWNRDKLLSLRSVYIEHRERALINRQSDLASDTSAKAQNEKDKIYKQLKEIETFKAKIDELLAEGYNPILDDGVGKNIAPLQNKGMLAAEVLNSDQLKKYLKADW